MTKCPTCDWIELDDQFYPPSFAFLLRPGLRTAPDYMVKHKHCNLCSLGDDPTLQARIQADFTDGSRGLVPGDKRPYTRKALKTVQEPS